MDSPNDIAARILSSPKYRGLLPRTVEAAVRESLARHGEKEAEERARTLLHRAWGAFWPTRPRFDRLLEKLREAAATGDVREAVLPLLSLHSSTRERLPALYFFYERLFDATGVPGSIVDWGCGFNPLTLPWMNLPADARYTGLDIDLEQNGFLDSALPLIGFPQPGAVVGEGDIMVDEPPPADLALAFKVLPLLEQRRKGAGLEAVRRQKARTVAVSFPSASLSGGKRKMGDFHADAFMKQAQGEGWKAERIDFPGEVVVIIKK